MTTASTYIGSRITSGLIVFLAYGLSLTRFVGKKQNLALIPLALCAFAMLFSISRTLFLINVLFHVIFFWKSIAKNPGRVVLFMVFVVIGVTIAAKPLSRQYRFDRLLDIGGHSTNMRLSGIKAGWVAASKAPVLGHGPGLLYDYFRTTFRLSSYRTKRRSTTILGYASPMEPHNTYALLAAEHGAIGLLTFMGGMVYCWRRTQTPKKMQLTPVDRVYRTGFGAIWLSWLILMWVHSMQLINLKASLMFWLFAGMGLLWRVCVSQENGALPKYQGVPNNSYIVSPAPMPNDASGRVPGKS